MANRFQPIDPQPDALLMPNQTDTTIAQIRTEQLTTFGAADWCHTPTSWAGCTIQTWHRTAELCALQAAKDEFESAGATLAVVTPVYWFGRADTPSGVSQSGLVAARWARIGISSDGSPRRV